MTAGSAESAVILVVQRFIAVAAETAEGVTEVEATGEGVKAEEGTEATASFGPFEGGDATCGGTYTRSNGQSQRTASVFEASHSAGQVAGEMQKNSPASRR